MGIKYPILHPEPLYTFATSGLSIYSTKLKSHDGEINAIIGGSFEFFVSVAGAVGNLMQSFNAGLQRFRDGAMPSILGILLLIYVTPGPSGCSQGPGLGGYVK